MEQASLPDRPANGGFPEPLASARVRVVAARHAACGVRTRVRLPEELPAGTVRRLRCAGCHEAYEVEEVDEVRVEAPEPAKPRARPRLPRFNPEGRTWRVASVPIAAAAVVAALLLIQGSGDDAPVVVAAEGAEGGAGAELVRADTFTVALPQGWERVKPQGGATFAAVAEGGAADATLWIERDPKLGFGEFEARSLKQLRALAGSAAVAERVAAPTAEGTIVRLAADAPAGEPRYEATLRAAGPYRFYLATTVQPDATRAAIDGVELIHGSFTPEANAG